MAIKFVNLGSKLGSGGTQEALLKQLMEQYGEQATPKVSGLGRIMAPLTGIGSIIDAYYDARYQDKDAGILNVLKNYGLNLGQGVGTLLTGRNYEQDQKMQGASELLDVAAPGYKNSAIGKSVLGRMGVDILAGLVTDPTTYFGFGPASLADDVIKGGLKAAGLGNKTVTKLLPKLTGGTMDDVARTLNAMGKIGKTTGADVADNLYVYVMQNVGKSTAKSGALKLLGKTISESPAVVKGAKAVISPLGAGMDALGAASKKLTPGLRSNLLDVFDPIQGAIEGDRGEDAANLLKFSREASGLNRATTAKLIDSGLFDTRDKILKEGTEDELAQIPKLIEASREVTSKAGKVRLYLPKGITKNQKTFLTQYFDFERGITKEMKGLGLSVLDPKEMGYIARENIKGFKERLLKGRFKKAGLGESYDKLMQDKRILKDLNRDGFVKKETLQKVLSDNELAAFKQYNPGLLGEMISGGGSQKDRLYKTREQAEKAGVVFGKNPMSDIYDQTLRQNEQILSASFAQDLVKSPSFSKTAKGLMTTPVTIPGVGQFYTDKHMAKIAQDYVSRYTTEDGMDKLLTNFDKIQGVWKKWVTGKGPNFIPYNVRNLIDDNIRLVVGGADITKLPGDYELATDLFKYEDLINKVGKKEALKQIDQTRAASFLKSMGVDAKDPIDELWNRSVKSGVYSDASKSVSEMDMGRPKSAMDKIGREGKAKPMELIREKYDDIITLDNKAQRREQATRMATYFNFWRKEGVESAGIDAVQNISFNYNELSKAEREVFKRIMPFYGFVKNNIKFYMDLMKDNPERLARYYNVYEGLKSGSQSKFGEDWEAMPDYVKDTLSIPLSKEGDKLKYLSGMNLGIEGLGDIPIDRGGLGRAAGNLSPVLNMLLELTSGKDLFRNQDILETNQGYNYGNRSELLKKLMNYRKYPVELDNGTTYEKETVSPEARYFLENVPFVSTLNTGARRLADLKDKERVLEALTNMIFPGRINVGRVDDARSRIERKELEDFYKLMQRKGLADVYKSFYIPKGLREQLLK